MHGRTHRVLIECSSQSRPTSNSRGTSPHGGSVRAVLRCCSCCPCRPFDRLAQFREVERTRAPEGPVERPAPDGLLKAGRNGVHISTPAGQPIAKIGDQASPDQHHSQQTPLVRALPAAHTRSLRTCPVTHPARHCLSLPPRCPSTPWGVRAPLSVRGRAPPGLRPLRTLSPGPPYGPGSRRASRRPRPLCPGGCRCASRSAARRDGRSALPCRWPVTAGSRAR